MYSRCVKIICYVPCRMRNAPTVYVADAQTIFHLEVIMEIEHLTHSTAGSTC